MGKIFALQSVVVVRPVGHGPVGHGRADMVYFRLPSGGEVFSTGSITFCGSLPHNNFDNNVSALLANVVDRFLR